MRWVSRKERAIDKFIKDLEWKEWFAWKPVQVRREDDIKETVWFEKVYRRREYPYIRHDGYSSRANLRTSVSEFILNRKGKLCWEYSSLTDIMTGKAEEKHVDQHISDVERQVNKIIKNATYGGRGVKI